MARLSYGARKKLPRASFALPAKLGAKNPAGKGAYPVNDESHARNALSRVAQFGSAQEKAAVRRKVREKFPNIGKQKK